jgi:DNA-binding transcriptional regulator LsrR (DeoR family)
MNDEIEYERSLASKAAWYYYIDNMTQKDIASILGISRMKVIKLVEQARKDKLVQFTFPENDSIKISLEHQLIQKYNLQDALVVPSAEGETKLKSITNAAAMYLNNRLDDNAFINMGYGVTVGQVLNNLAALSNKKISFISLTGGVSPYLPNNTSKRFSAGLYLIPSPILMSSAHLAEEMSQEYTIKQIFQMNSLANFTVISVGGIGKNATIMQSHVLSSGDFLKLSMSGAVGDILMHFIDKNGKPIKSEIDDRLISTSLTELKKYKNVVGVAEGDAKVNVIKAALQGGYLDILITDESTAKKILKE